MVELRSLSVHELLQTHAGIGTELRRREIARTSNNPLGDIAEHLFCEAFGWVREDNNKTGCDAQDENGHRYEIKGRRIWPGNRSRQVSALRKLDEGLFDTLAGVVFSESYDIEFAVLVPRVVVMEQSGASAHTNAARFHLRASLTDVQGVTDVTKRLAAHWAAMNKVLND